MSEPKNNADRVRDRTGCYIRAVTGDISYNYVVSRLLAGPVCKLEYPVVNKGVPELNLSIEVDLHPRKLISSVLSFLQSFIQLFDAPLS